MPLLNESADLLVALVTSGRLHIVEPRNVNEAISSSDRALQACRISPNCASMWMAKLAQICLQLEHARSMPVSEKILSFEQRAELASGTEDAFQAGWRPLRRVIASAAPGVASQQPPGCHHCAFGAAKLTICSL